jgi:RNA polymerase sigma-70 factor, ECF subfamily
MNPTACAGGRRSHVHVASRSYAGAGMDLPADPEPLADQIAAMRTRLYHFACSLTREPEEAADLAQETVVRALGATGSFTPGTNLKAWLFRILRNLYLNRRRDARGWPGDISLAELPVEIAAEGGARPVEREALARAELAAVLEAFHSLPPIFALPLHLTAVEQLSYAETAAVLGIPIGTVMSRVYRGRRLLLARLEGREAAD